MILSLFNIVLAATTTYQWDVPLPPAPSGYLPTNLNFASLVTYLYYWGLGIGGLLAFIRLIISGIQWGTSAGNVKSLKDAQDAMTSTIFGLILLLGAWLLLNTINPQIVNPGEKITEALQEPKYEAENIETELVDLNTYEVKIPPRQNVSWNYFTGIGGIGGGGLTNKRPGSGNGEVVSSSKGSMSLNEARISCSGGSGCWNCSTPLPATLINILLEMKNQGISFSVTAGSDVGYSHHQHRAVDITPASKEIMDFLAKQYNGCGEELFGPANFNNCYFKNGGVVGTFNCSKLPSYKVQPHNYHIHFSITKSCAGDGFQECFSGCTCP